MGIDYSHHYNCPSCHRPAVKYGYLDFSTGSRKLMAECSQCKYKFRGSFTNFLIEMRERNCISNDEIIRDLLGVVSGLEHSVLSGKRR